MDKIDAQWSIHPRNLRTARMGDLTLVSGNDRDGTYGPVRWSVLDAGGNPVASGEVWQTKRYSSLVREAMFEAEQAAKAWLA